MFALPRRAISVPRRLSLLLHNRKSENSLLRRGWLQTALFLSSALIPSLELRAAPADTEVSVPAALLPYSRTWGQPHSEAAINNFHSWARRYSTAADRSTKERLLNEGVALAKARRAFLARLVATDPAQVFDLATPASARQGLPAEITAELETPVSGVGDLTVQCVFPVQGARVEEAFRRTVTLNGRTYSATVYGRRVMETTKQGIPLHGIVVNGVLLVHESALRVLSADEPTAPAKPFVDLSNKPGRVTGSGVAVRAEVAGRIYRFANNAQAQNEEAKLDAAEATIGPDSPSSATAILEAAAPLSSTSAPDTGGGVAASPYTVGNKNVLIIRVDFSDLPGDPKSRGSTTYTAGYVQNLADTQIAPYYVQSSYGLTSLTNTVTTKVYRMPQTGSFYAVNNANTQLHSDAVAAAAADYTTASYDRIVVLFSPLENFTGSKITYGGLSDVGSIRTWVNGEFDFRVVAHELGHSYGLFHANLWQVSDKNPISTAGSTAEYGDDFDTMGANYSNDQRTDFNPWFKNRLAWISASQVQTITASGTYRVFRFDNSAATGVLSLKVTKDGTRNYWISCRRKFTTNGSLQHGAYIVWGYNTNQQSNLLDLTTPGTSDLDAALAVGNTFFDTAAKIAIRPLTEGGSDPSQYLDIQVTLSAAAPVIVTQPSAQTVAAGQTATFSVSATANPAPNYQWLKNGSVISGANSGTITLNNVQAADAGDYSVTLDNGLGTATSTVAPLAVIVPPFQQWQLTHFGGSAGDTSIAGDAADPDADGLSNLLEYALRSDPLVPSVADVPTAVLAVSPGDGLRHLTLTVNLAASATDITVAAEVSGDLVNWRSDSGSVEVASDSTSAGVRTLVFRDLTPSDGTSARMMRLKVSRP